MIFWTVELQPADRGHCRCVTLLRIRRILR